MQLLFGYLYGGHGRQLKLPIVPTETLHVVNLSFPGQTAHRFIT